MKLLIIFGDTAVGKMTVGQELAKITGLRLFYNHLTIEPVIEVFGQYNRETTERLRSVYFEEFVKTDNYGMIFTYLWNLDSKSEWEFIGSIHDLFVKNGADVYFAELIASKEIRLERNSTENRLKYKPSKRDSDSSVNFLLNHSYRCVSRDGEIPYKNYIRIDNSFISPETVARQIKERFGFV